MPTDRARLPRTADDADEEEFAIPKSDRELADKAIAMHHEALRVIDAQELRLAQQERDLHTLLRELLEQGAEFNAAIRAVCQRVQGRIAKKRKAKRRLPAMLFKVAQTRAKEAV